MAQQLNDIESKLKQLVKAHTDARKEIQRLQKENLALKQQSADQTAEIEGFHQKLAAAKLNGLQMDQTAKKELESRINSYLKDIDKCLTILNS